MAHPSEELVRSAYTAFESGDMDALFGHFSDDISFHLPGDTPLSGDHNGKEALSSFFQQVMERSAGTVKLEVHDAVGNEEHVVGLVTISGSPKGEPLSYRVVHVWHAHDGKLSEMWEFPEMDGFNAFWG